MVNLLVMRGASDQLTLSEGGCLFLGVGTFFFVSFFIAAAFALGFSSTLREVVGAGLFFAFAGVLVFPMADDG